MFHKNQVDLERQQLEMCMTASFFRSSLPSWNLLSPKLLS